MSDLLQQMKDQLGMSPKSSYYNPDKYLRLAIAEIERLRAAAARADVGAVEKQRDAECERANRLAEFIREKGLQHEYHEWSCDLC